MSEHTKGALALIFASTVWGLSTLYYKWLEHVPPMELMSHRVVWSFVIFFAILAFRRQLPEFRSLIRPNMGLLLIIGSSVMISVNWFLFIWAVQAERVLETSLGYFIQPLVAVAFGVWLFAERPKAAQWVAFMLAVFGVGFLTFWLGKLPWVSLVLGITFGLYGAIKKKSRAGAIVSVTAEALFVVPIALSWLVAVHLGSVGTTGGAFAANMSDSILLIFSGVITAGPLMLLSYAAQRIPLATVGVLQYINPSLQFLCAVAIFAEPFTPTHGIAFALIWMALAIYSWSEFARAASPDKA